MLTLTSHPAHPPLHVGSVEARVIGLDQNWLRMRWRIEGAGALIVPPFAGRGRADELWRTTCFEMFLRPEGGTAYCEFNLSPSERWAAYDFATYREGMGDRSVSIEPSCTLRLGSSFAIFDAAIPRDAIPDGSSAMNVTAVLEEEGGIISYWALAHPPTKADFHDPACFIAELAAPQAP